MPADANMLWNVGITKMSSTDTAIPATEKMTAGYTLASVTLRTMASFFSRNCAMRSRMVSRIPPASPAATMFTYRSLKALGCLRSASARVWPLSTSYTTARVTSARNLFSGCCARMSSACTSGSPALIMVANWRVKITTSRVLIPAPNLSLNCFGASRTCTTTRRFLRRWARTSSRVANSPLFWTISPLTFRAVYSKTGIVHLPPAPLAARGDLRGTSRGTATRQRLAIVQRGLPDHPQEVVGIRGHAEAFVFGHLARNVVLVERVVQRLHPVLFPRLHHRRDLLDFVVPDQGADRGRADEDLRRHDTAASFGLLQQGLRDHTLEHEGQLGADLRLLVRREDVDDAVDALGRGVGVQRREREVAGFGDGERRRRRLEVAHFAHEHDVRVLPQRVFQGGVEAGRVRSHLALVDDALLVPVDELDRVFHRDDVALELLVDLVDHRRQGRALPRPRRAGHQDQAARLLGQFRHHPGEPQVVERFHAEGDLADHHRDAAALLEDVAAEARQVLDAEREVELVLRFEALLLVLRQHRVGEGQRVLRREHLGRRGVHDVAVDPDLGDLARDDVEVGGILLDHLFEQGPQIHRHCMVSFTRPFLSRPLRDS